MKRRWRSRFDDAETDPLLSLTNLVDIMLVFVCGLMAALVAGQIGSLPEEAPPRQDHGVAVERGKELPTLPDGVETQGKGYEAVGQVYRDPNTGKLILVGP